MLGLGVISSEHLFETELGVTAFPWTPGTPPPTPLLRCWSPVCTVRGVPPVPGAGPRVPRVGGGRSSAWSRSVCVDVVCREDSSLARWRGSALPEGARHVTMCASLVQRRTARGSSHSTFRTSCSPTTRTQPCRVAPPCASRTSRGSSSGSSTRSITTPAMPGELPPGELPPACRGSVTSWRVCIFLCSTTCC